MKLLEKLVMLCFIFPRLTVSLGKIKRRPSEGKSPHLKRPCHCHRPRGQQAYNVAGQQAAAFKKLRLVPDKFSKLAERARDLRNDMVKSFTQFSDIARQFADPAFHAKLLFPSPFSSLPKRFEIDSEHKWFYAGREKFADLVKKFESERWGLDRSALWIYGTKGYGKSHLLAALVCYLISRNQRVVYLHDCRECLRNPVGYMRAAMLFAWGDDTNIQERIIPLDTMDSICNFLNAREDFIFIIDQLNVLDQGLENCDSNRNRSIEVSQWLTICRADRKTVLSTSANYQAYIQRSVKENTEESRIHYMFMEA